MLVTGDKLICVTGNSYYEEGETYIVGRFVNDKFFELMTGYDNERWYASVDASGIKVQFEHIFTDHDVARFVLEDDILEDCEA